MDRTLANTGELLKHGKLCIVCFHPVNLLEQGHCLVDIMMFASFALAVPANPRTSRTLEAKRTVPSRPPDEHPRIHSLLFMHTLLEKDDVNQVVYYLPELPLRFEEVKNSING